MIDAIPSAIARREKEIGIAILDNDKIEGRMSS